MTDNQVLINRDLFLRLVERYLLTEIQLLECRNSKPDQSGERMAWTANEQGIVDSLRGQFAKCESVDDFARWYAQLDSVLRRRENA
jgi:hypothetical protein